MEKAILEKKAGEIRKRVIDLTYHSQSGHSGPSLSWADIAATLFFKEMKLNPEDVRGKIISQENVTIAPKGQRDIFILSKGHAVPTVYSAISLLNSEYIPKDALKTLRHIDSSLEGHPVSGSFPLIDASTGSLGQGLSIAQGYALGNKLQGLNSRVYVVLGDGEIQKGQVYEAAMSTTKFAQQGRLSGLTVILDNNGYQGDGAIASTMPSLNPIPEKWKSFGWYVQQVDGHNHEQLIKAYENARSVKDKPSIIISHTTKGKGVSFMEQNPAYWHGGVVTDDHYKQAMSELNGEKNE